jgi:hypothetical protein
MNFRSHLTKIEHLEKTASKLDAEDDYEVLVEIYMLASAHCINAALHKLGVVKENKDIKHNQIFSFLKEEKLGKDTEAARDSMKKLDDLRPSHVYGKGKNGKTATKAKGYFLTIKAICDKIIEDGR